jgi:serine/threonine protein kinase
MFDAFENPIPHIEMEYIDGYKLNGKLIRDLDKYPKPLNPKEAINLTKQISEGLKHAHSKNIIHRDIKPSNILLTSNLVPKITDWGLAKIGAKSSTATTTKALTLLYSAPEQIDEEEYGKTDKRTDIYQLGVLFYELLTGRLPYEGTSPTQISLKIVNPDKKPLPPSKINPSLSIFDGLFEKLLAKRKEDRFQSIDEFLEALKSIEELIKEKEELKKTLTQTKDKLKKSTDIKEIERLTKNLIDSTTKLALKCAKANDKVGLLDALETLKDYVKSEDNKKELEGAIKHVEYLIKTQTPIGKQTIEALEVLLNRVRREF